MNRILLKDYLDDNKKSNYLNYLLVNDAKNTDVSLTSGDFDILFNDIKDGCDIKILINENSNVKISFFLKSNVEKININIVCKNNSNLDIYFADFSYDKVLADIKIVLKEENSRVKWHLASLTSKNDNKAFNVSVDHDAKNTYAKVDNYGVCKDSGKLLFAGTSHIKNGSVDSETYQNAKIMVFDKESNAIAKPILKIDENDIVANHAAVVGKVNEEHLFYLMSRGLNESQAKEIITFGYLKPILEGFIEDNIKEEITSLIEGRM